MIFFFFESLLKVVSITWCFVLPFTADETKLKMMQEVSENFEVWILCFAFLKNDIFLILDCVFACPCHGTMCCSQGNLGRGLCFILPSCGPRDWTWAILIGPAVFFVSWAFYFHTKCLLIFAILSCVRCVWGAHSTTVFAWRSDTALWSGSLLPLRGFWASNSGFQLADLGDNLTCESSSNPLVSLSKSCL